MPGSLRGSPNYKKQYKPLGIAVNSFCNQCCTEQIPTNFKCEHHSYDTRHWMSTTCVCYMFTKMSEMASWKSFHHRWDQSKSSSKLGLRCSRKCAANQPLPLFKLGNATWYGGMQFGVIGSKTCQRSARICTLWICCETIAKNRKWQNDATVTNNLWRAARDEHRSKCERACAK